MTPFFKTLKTSYYYCSSRPYFLKELPLLHLHFCNILFFNLSLSLSYCVCARWGGEGGGRGREGEGINSTCISNLLLSSTKTWQQFPSIKFQETWYSCLSFRSDNKACSECPVESQESVFER